LQLVATESPVTTMISLTVDEAQQFQEIVGFGGAFTESAAWVLARLSRTRRTQALRAYFDPDAGLRYSLCRTHINSCDFSLAHYSFDDTPGDTDLRDFSIAHDRQWLLPLIHDARAISGGRFRLLASPWSPPAWMKTTGQRNHGGALKPEYYPVWARFIAKYIQAYEAEGIPLWGITVQNEPVGRHRWDSCEWTADAERDFVRDFLGPQLERDGLAHIRIFAVDHNKDIIVARAAPFAGDAAARRRVAGIGVHWYAGDHFDQLDRVHALLPDKLLLATEACCEGGVKLNQWDRGERYAHDIIGDLNHWVSGWLDWNIALDTTGGPNHANNFCDAPIIADPANDALHYQSSFHYLGHFSRFIEPGAIRIGIQTSDPRLEATAVRNPDGAIVVVALNRTEDSLPFRLILDGSTADTTLPPHAIMTLVGG